MAKTVTVPEINLQDIVVRVTGATPLLCNRISDRALAGLSGSGIPAITQKTRDTDQEFFEARYLDDEGRDCFPGAGIQQSLVNAGGRFGADKMTVLRGALRVMEPLVPIIASIENEGLDNEAVIYYTKAKGSPKPTKAKHVARNPNARGALVLVYRPLYSPWQMRVPVTYNASIISYAEVLNLFQLAGFAIGWGCWRPEKNGTYGQFAIDERQK